MNEAVTSMTKCCFWCLKPLDPDKKLQEGEKMYFESYDPCERCEELFSHGIQVIGVSTSMVMPGMVAVLKDGEGKPLYPTGSMFLATEEWTRELLKDEPEKLKEVLSIRKLLMPDEIVGEIIKELDDVPDLIESAEEEFNENN